jgi:hypothetical protein
MPTPSIVIVPARLKAATLFSQLPLTGEADLSLVQASGNATRVNASGFIDVPRTNLCLQSENFSAGYWSKSNIAFTSGAATAPDNTTNAFFVYPTVSTNNAVIYNYEVVVSGTTYTTSAFVKASGKNWVFIRGVNDNQGVWFNLASGTLGTQQSSTTGSIQNYGNGWFRCAVTQTASSINGRVVILVVDGDSSTNVTASGTNGLLYWGAQLQIGNTATTYIPTTSSIRTLFAGVAQDGALSPNVPRLDYRNLVGAVDCPALLVEPSATNLAFHSEIWASGNNWTLDAVTRVTGSTSAFLAPDGSFSANAISPTSGNVFHGLYSNSPTQYTYISGTIYTQSAFFKAGGTNLPVSGSAGRYVQLTYTGGGQFTQNGYANFDLQLGTVAVVSGTSADTNRTARIENYGNGWYRCSFTATCNAAGNGIGVLPVLVNASGNTRAQSFSGTVTDTLYGWGAQLEVGSVATSYIPTTTASATRGADNYSVSGAVSGFIGLTSGAIYAEVDVRNWEASGRVVALSDGTSDGSIVIMENANRSFSLSVTSAGFSTVSITTASGLYNGLHRIAVAYKKDDYAVYLNGQLVGTNTTAGVPSVNRIFIGKIESSGTTNYFNDRIRAIAFYNTRPTNSELATLTQVDYTNLVWDTYTSRTSISTELPECLFVRHIELLNI